MLATRIGKKQGEQDLGERAEAEPHNEEGSDGDLRDDLEEDDQRVERSLEQRHRDDDQRQRDADHGGRDEPQYHLVAGHQ
jgi:hypothetical protein